ncbi:UNVERIFIED_ORG: hypothetical protein FHR35_002700 [Microbispora rosea subsp. rosea]
MVETQHSETSSIKFQLYGVSELLELRELRVPHYQRSYCWKVESEVTEYWDDLMRAFRSGDEYFLGTVVLSGESEDSRMTVIDGQQRLVTTSLLLAAIRDELKARGHRKHSVLERDYLLKETMESEGENPRLVLNAEDDPVFREIVLSANGSTDNSTSSLSKAFTYLKAQVGNAALAVGDEATDRLLQWVSFLKKKVRVGVVEVPTDADAYIIFETLNNRGADLTIADLLKNHIFGRSGDNLDKVREYWARSLGTLELSAADSKFTKFLRHYWSSKHGLVRERDLYSSIKKVVNSKSAALDFSIELSRAASKYAALSDPNHEEWVNLGYAGKADLQVLSRFNLTPSRILLLAAMECFKVDELKKLIRALVSWSVRGMVAETINSTNTEEKYSDAAVAIRSGEAVNVDQVRAKLGTAIPSDDLFREAFSLTRVPKNLTARYYLCALERAAAGDQEPELVPNEDGDAVNLEHVLPQKPTEDEWPEFPSPEERFEWAYRLGNMVLLPKGKNGKIGNAAFAVKAPILKASSLALTREVGEEGKWTSAEIAERQRRLAEIALRTWPR